MLILKANMQVIVLKSVWGHVSMQKHVLKMAAFSGAVILIMLKVKQ